MNIKDDGRHGGMLECCQQRRWDRDVRIEGVGGKEGKTKV